MSIGFPCEVKSTGNFYPVRFVSSSALAKPDKPNVPPPIGSILSFIKENGSFISNLIQQFIQ